jgi:hypothetical protein
MDRVFDPAVTKPGVPPLSGAEESPAAARPAATERRAAPRIFVEPRVRSGAVAWAVAAALALVLAAALLR